MQNEEKMQVDKEKEETEGRDTAVVENKVFEATNEESKEKTKVNKEKEETEGDVAAVDNKSLEAINEESKEEMQAGEKKAETEEREVDVENKNIVAEAINEESVFLLWLHFINILITRKKEFARIYILINLSERIKLHILS